MDATFQVPDKQLYLLILKFLKERGLLKSYIALETETKTSLFNYSQEIATLRKLILEGEFEESEQFLVPFLEKFSSKMDVAMYEIKKQYFLELLEIGPDYQIMTRLLKSINQYTTKENYKKLFFLLSVENINDHPDYVNWTPEYGRLECFERVKNCIDEVYHFVQEENIVQNNITTMLERLLNFELKDKQKFDRLIYECHQNSSNEISILDDSIIGQSANKHKVNFYSQEIDKTPSFDYHKSTNFPLQQNQLKQQQQQQGQKGNIQGQQSVVQGKPFLSLMQKNNKIENESIANSYLQQSQVQQTQNEIKKNEIDFMELDESYLVESQQTEFLENYQNKVRQLQNKSYLKGQKLLASNNNPSLEGSSYYNAPGFVQSEHIGKDQAWDSNFYSQSMPPQQQVQGLKPLQNNNYTTGKSQIVPHSQLLEQEKKLHQHHLIKESNNEFIQSYFEQKQQLNQEQHAAELLSIEMDMAKSSSVKCMRKKKLSFHHRNKSNHEVEIPFINFYNNIQQGSEEDQYSNHNQEEKEEDVEDEEDELQEQENEEEEEEEENEDNQEYNNNQAYQEQYQGDSKYYGYNQSELPEEQSGALFSKGKQFYGNDSNLDQEERPKKSANKSNVSSLNQSAAAANNESKLRQSKQSINQSQTSEINPNNKISQLQQSSTSTQQVKQSGVTQNKSKNQSNLLNNPSANIQHQVLDHDDFQLYTFPKEFLNQTSDLSMQNQYSQVKQPMKSKSSTYQNNQLSNNTSQTSQPQNIGSVVKGNNQKRTINSLQESTQIFSNNYEELIEVCQIKDIQPIRTAQFSPDGEFFVLGTNSKSIKCFSIKEIVKNYRKYETSTPIWEKKNHHDGSIYTIDWSKKEKDGQFIATGSNDSTIKVINVPQYPYDNLDKDFNTITLNGHKGIVRTLRFHPDSSKIYSGGLPETSIRIWDLEKRTLIGKLEGHTDAINSLDIDGEGNTLVSVSKDNTLRVWDLKANKQITSIDLTDKKYGQLNYVNLNNGFCNTNLKNLLKYSKKQMKSAVSENTACVAHTNGLVSVWDLNYPKKSLYEIQNHTADCRSVEFDPTGNYMISTSFDKTICIYNINQEKILTQITNHTDKVVLSKFHPFFPFILSTSADFTSRIFAPSEFIKNFQQQQQ